MHRTREIIATFALGLLATGALSIAAYAFDSIPHYSGPRLSHLVVNRRGPLMYVIILAGFTTLASDAYRRVCHRAPSTSDAITLASGAAFVASMSCLAFVVTVVRGLNELTMMGSSRSLHTLRSAAEYTAHCVALGLDYVFAGTLFVIAISITGLLFAKQMKDT